MGKRAVYGDAERGWEKRDANAMKANVAGTRVTAMEGGYNEGS